MVEFFDLHPTRPVRTDEYPIVSDQAPRGGGVEFVLALGSALHRYGAPAHRLEHSMRLTSAQLGLEGRFFSTPTSIFASFGKPEELRTCLIRTEPGEHDLERLANLDQVAYQVIRGHLAPAQGAQEVEKILAAPSRYGPWVTFLCFALAAAGAARLFGGGWVEIGVATVSSLLIGVMDWASKTIATINRVMEASSGFVAATIAVLAGAFVAPLSLQVATLASLIVLLPGLSLTTAMTELGTRNLISGTSRLMGAIIVFLQLGFGVALGTTFAKVLPPIERAVLAPLPPWTEAIAIVVLAIAITVLLKASPRDFPAIMLLGAIAYLSARLGVRFLGPELGAFAGALVLGMSSNALATLRNRPAVTTIVPGLMLLVPGSIGFRSLESLLARDVIAGVGTAFSMVMIAVALGAGLLTANAVVPPRKVL